MHKPAFLLGLLLLLVTLSLDQWSKHAMLEMLAGMYQPIALTSFFDVVLVWNRGISFGMLAGQGVPYMLVALSVFIMVILVVWMYRSPSKLVGCALGCVMGGAIGNVIDRLRYGAVVDFLDFHIGAHHWPAFNLADSSIFIGVVLLCISSMLSAK